MRLAPLLLAASLSLALAGCRDKALDPPAPEGKDVVKGAVLAAAEAPEGIRLYKVIEIEDLPPPIGDQYHLLAYDPKAKTFEDARALWREGKVAVVKDNVIARKVLFIKRDYRVIGVEGVSPDERKGLERDQLAATKKGL